MIKKVLKFVLIGIAVKMGVYLLDGIVLDLAARLLRRCFGNIPTNPLITLKKSPLKSSFFSFCE